MVGSESRSCDNGRSAAGGMSWAAAWALVGVAPSRSEEPVRMDQAAIARQSDRLGRQGH